jgi:beta-mannanase
MHGALPLIQIDPGNVSLADITDGKYDYYMRSYATEVAEFRATVVLELGDELNGTWYRWGSADPSARLYVAAWRHIVEIFRSEGASNVTWLWTINAIAGPRFASPRPWWPGGNYVNWVGIDGYYYQSSTTFDSLIGPTIGVVRAFTHKPVLIAETGVSPAAGKAAKIPNLFSGVRAYGLLGFVWRDVKQGRDWRIETDSAAVAAFKRAVRDYQRKRGP